MRYSYGPYLAHVEPVMVADGRGHKYQVVVFRYGSLVYEHLEDDLEEAQRSALAFFSWEISDESDA